MEQNLVSDEELIKRINNVLNDSKEEEEEEEEKNIQEHLENSSAEKFHDVSDHIEAQYGELGLEQRRNVSFGGRRDLELENQILASQLEAERRKSRELQSKFQLFENSVKYFERLNGQLETIKQTVEEDNLVLNDQGDYGVRNFEAMQKLRPKTVHTAANGNLSGRPDDADDGAAISSEPHTDDSKEGKAHVKSKRQDAQAKEEIAFRDAEDFKQLEQDLEIVKDKEGRNDLDAEKVFITKTEKKFLEDIGNLASRMRTPLDDKHQRFFEKDRRRFANRIVMPETQEMEKNEPVPTEIVTKTKEVPVNIASTELDGLRSYLLQLKELIARRETTWARTTERDYNQRVEITRFKNEVSHLRMLCEKRQKDIKERDQIIVAKDEEIKELQKRVQGLRNAVLKLEKKDDRITDTLEGLTNEVLENSQMVQRSYNVMKRASLLTKSGGAAGAANAAAPKTAATTPSTIRRSSSGSKDIGAKRPKGVQERAITRKIKSTSSNSNDEDARPSRAKSKQKVASPDKGGKTRHRGETGFAPAKKSSIERVDEKLQRIEDLLHSDVLKGDKKGHWKHGKHPPDAKGYAAKPEVDPVFQKKFTPSNSRMRQETLGAMTGLAGAGLGLGPKVPAFSDPKRQQGNAAILANALLAARNTNMFNF